MLRPTAFVLENCDNTENTRFEKSEETTKERFEKCVEIAKARLKKCEYNDTIRYRLYEK